MYIICVCVCVWLENAKHSLYEAMPPNMYDRVRDPAGRTAIYIPVHHLHGDNDAIAIVTSLHGDVTQLCLDVWVAHLCWEPRESNRDSCSHPV